MTATATIIGIMLITAAPFFLSCLFPPSEYCLKKSDCFLATDCIGTEKLVSGEYNTDVFAFGNSSIRKLLADIQIEEQNHAEMLYHYKTVNKMS